MSTTSVLLVSGQVILLVYLSFTGVITTQPILLFIQILGVITAIWGIITMRIGNFHIQPEVKSSLLITGGPYRYIRNPMYTGILLVFIPAVIAYSKTLRWLALGCLLVVLLLKIRREEQFLLERFGDQYIDYSTRTKRLIPHIF